MPSTNSGQRDDPRIGREKPGPRRCAFFDAGPYPSHRLGLDTAWFRRPLAADGRVTLGWTISRSDGVEILDMRWAERGGPTAIEPSHRGFGSRIIRMGLSGSGGVKLHYVTEGLTAEMSAPLHQIIQG